MSGAALDQLSFRAHLQDERGSSRGARLEIPRLRLGMTRRQTFITATARVFRYASNASGPPSEP